MTFNLAQRNLASFELRQTTFAYAGCPFDGLAGYIAEEANAMDGLHNNDSLRAEGGSAL